MLTYILAWFPMVVIAIINGGIREKVYRQHVGELRAHQISSLTGVILFGIYIYGVIRIWTPDSSMQAIEIGLYWFLMTIVFEFGFGHFVMHHSWPKLFADYNLRRGRVWILVLLWVLFAPALFYRILY